ncbi:PH domain-containing protein [Actinoplanes sp. N902-109]|uniref:PH domain-containing protein n=1 Tax=Actinoplanes sp. (strain N902-109) TaxID=649831 RepID=UPI0006877D75|nr:PH domain-containing protein [Actinoplanes sp. N902-109]
MAAQEWRVRPVLPVTKLLGAVALIVLVAAFGTGDPVQWVLAGAGAAGLAGWALRDLIRPVRLAADETGVTLVAGFAARRHLAWSQIERVRVDRRARRGIRSELLEIDAGESLHLFSVHELGTDPDEVAQALLELRSVRTSGTASEPPLRPPAPGR